MKIFQVFVTMFTKSSAADLLYVGKGKVSKEEQILLLPQCSQKRYPADMCQNDLACG